MTNRSNIAVYMHCTWCKRDGFDERIEVGFLTDGSLQLWCINHDVAIGPPFELRYPPLVAHLTCHDCREAEKHTHDHSNGRNEKSHEQVSGHDHGHDHGDGEKG